MGTLFDKSRMSELFGTFEKAAYYGISDTRVCSTKNEVERFGVTKSEVEIYGATFTRVQADTYSSPGGYVAAEICYAIKAGIGWVGLCRGHSKWTGYLGGNNGYSQETEFRLNFFSDDTFMTSARCLAAKQQMNSNIGS